jgi:hypothetical protein
LEKQVSDLRHQKQKLDSQHRATDSILDHKGAKNLLPQGFLNRLFKHIDKKISAPFRHYALSVNKIYISIIEGIDYLMGFPKIYSYG